MGNTHSVGVLGKGQLSFCVTRLVVTLLYISYRAACSNTLIVGNYRHINVRPSTHIYLICLTMKYPPLLLLMVIVASCQCRYEFLYRVIFLCAESGEE